MAVVYSIKDWDRNFEKAQLRKQDGPSRWVALPTKHDGKGFRRIMLRPDGPMIYGAWVLIVQVAAKCPVRGVLADSDGPLTPEDLAIKTTAPAKLFEDAIKVLCGKDIGWLVGEEWESGGIALPPHTEQDKQNKPTNQPPYPPATVFAAPTVAEGGRAGGLAFGYDSEAGPRKPRSAGFSQAVSTASRSDDATGQGNANSASRSVDASVAAATSPATEPQRTWPAALGWGAVQDRLASMGASQWKTATTEAKECGCTPQLAMQIIDHGTSKGFQVGAIICRLSKARPTLPIGEGWPLLEAPEVARKRSAANRAERERTDEESYQQTAADSQARAEERERRFGPELDSMDPDEVAEMVKPNPAMAKLFRKGNSPLVRAWLLTQLEKRAEVSS